MSIENPFEWYLECGKYAIENKYSMDYGTLFLLKDDAPSIVKKKYKKYIDLCKKPFQSLGLCIFDNGRIVDFLETDDPIEKEQIMIAKKLIEDGYIDNEPFIKT